jgi:chromosomal replication initiation ATPase DnaA
LLIGVQKVLGSVGELGHGRMRRVSLKDLIRKVSRTMQVEVSDLLSGSRRDKVSMARALVSYLAVREMGYSGVEVSRTLKLSGPGVTKCVEKGKNIIFNDENLRNRLIN